MHKIILGTVQFGLNYGISNFSGKPSIEEVYAILDTAHEFGIERLDTADAYGDSIDLIGNYHKNHKSFGILNKFSFSDNENDLLKKTESSLKKLNIDSFDVYSYHSFNDFITNKESENILSFLKKNGFVKKIGISIYTNEQFISAIDNDSIDVIQIPFSILDNHNNRGLLINKARERSKEIHCRSVFLQGLIFMNEQNIPVKLRPLLNYITKLQKFSMEENLSLEELALTYVMNYHGIDGILIGVENVNQLVSNMNSVRSDKAEKISEFIDSIHVSEKDLLNPQNWK